MSRGFTLVELVISIAIFVIMTALIVAKYGNFNQGALLTDTAYDIALVLHTAQSYGLSVHNAGTLGGASNFQSDYGVDFNTTNNDACNSNGVQSSPTDITLFADTYPIGSPDRVCGASDTGVTSYAITRGATISSLCAGSASSCAPVNQLDVTFLRPNPDATICGIVNGGSPDCTKTYGQITLLAGDGSTKRTVGVYQNGQIVVNQ